MSELKAISIKRSIDFDIVGENILDIADFAVEKYEFRHETNLAPEVREAATTAVREALWARVEELRLKRNQILAGMFDLADETAKRVVEGG
jgi:hypothetical protein